MLGNPALHSLFSTEQITFRERENMAPKFQILPHRPAVEEKEREPSSDEEEDLDAESSDSEEGSSSGETQEGSSEDEEQNKTLSSNKPQIPVSKPEPKQTPQKNGWVSDPDSESETPDYQLQPIRKPPTSSSASGKRPQREGDTSPDRSGSKKLKAEEKTPSISSAGPGIIRLWSETDEITVLKGMIELRKLEGQDPNSEGFYNFIKGKLQDNFSKEQLRTKIVRMKKRFLNATKKADGTDPVFSKPHEVMMFELSKKLWGENINNRPVGSAILKTKKDNAKADKTENAIVKAEKAAVGQGAIDMNEKNGEEGEFWSKYPNLSLSFNNIAGNFPSLAMTEGGTCFLKERVSLIGNAKAKELDEKWRQLLVEEAELNYKMLSLMTEQVRVALNK